MIEYPLEWHIPVWNQLYQLAQNNKLPHALLLSGPNGTGKSQFGQAFAQLLLCEGPVWADERKRYMACNQCPSCHLGQAQTHPNYYIIKPEGESNTPKIVIEQIRKLTDSLQNTAKHQANNATHHYSTLVVIQAAEYLNTAASNALLKTLEEPLPGILFLITVDQPQHLLVTIQSRCHRVMLPAPSFQTGIEWLGQQIKQIDNQAISQKQLETTLQLADYLPLKALTLIQNPETTECYTQLFDSLLKLRNRTANPIQVAQTWSTYPIETVFNYLYLSIYRLIQLKLGGLAQDQSLISMPDNVNLVVDSLDKADLFNWLDRVQQVKKEMKEYNLNYLLALENLACQLSPSD